MKILFLSNNDISNDLFVWLKNEANEQAEKYNKSLEIDYLKGKNFDFIISYNYKYIIKKELIVFMKKRIINLHISYLPWNKGVHPNLWSFIENTPKGVTIHIITEKIDSGPILVQKEVYINESSESLRSSYEKLNKEIQELFKKNWDKIKKGKIKPYSQQKMKGNIHYKADFKRVEYLLVNKGWDIPILELKQKSKINNEIKN